MKYTINNIRNHIKYSIYVTNYSTEIPFPKYGFVTLACNYH